MRTVRPLSTEMLFHCCRIIVFAAIIVVFGRVPADAGTMTGGGYEISNDTLSEGGSAGVTTGAYSLTFSVGQAAGQEDLYQTPGAATSGYMIEGGYVSGMEAVFDLFSVTAGASAPVSLGYTGAASDTVPGARITYVVTYSNKGEAAVCTGGAAACPGNLSEIPISSQLPAQADYEAGTISLNAVAQTDAQDFSSGTNNCSYNSGARTVECVISMVAGASGTIRFSAIIK